MTPKRNGLSAISVTLARPPPDAPARIWARVGVCLTAGAVLALSAGGVDVYCPWCFIGTGDQKRLTGAPSEIVFQPLHYADVELATAHRALTIAIFHSGSHLTRSPIRMPVPAVIRSALNSIH